MMGGQQLHPNGAVSSIIALGVARQVAENSLSSGATTSNVPEGTNLYFTAARARSVISALAPISYSSSTGQITATVGTASGTLCAGNDARLSDARTPLAHTHIIENITGLQTALDGKEPSFFKNTAFNKNFGSTSDTVCQGNDTRLSDSRTPLTHIHAISDVTGLQTAFDDKANVVHSHSISDILLLQSKLDEKQNIISGYNGTLNVITSIDFGTSTVTNALLTISNGIITNVTI